MEENKLGLAGQVESYRVYTFYPTCTFPKGKYKQAELIFKYYYYQLTGEAVPQLEMDPVLLRTFQS